MPVDFQDIRRQVQKWAEKAPLREKDLQERRAQGLSQLEAQADQLAALRTRVEQAGRADPYLRCAKPAHERLDSSFNLPAVSGAAVVLAADGSQIYPDRHAAVQYCLINVSVFEIRPGQPEAPRQSTLSRLLDDDEIYTPNGMISEDVVALRRDLEERKFLAKMAAAAPQPAITLTDGPLELFRESVSRESPESRRLFHEYLEGLKDLAELGVITAGYVDKPRGDLVVRMLEISLLPEAELDQAGKKRPLIGLTDANLFRDRLQPCMRSSVFAIHSHSAREFEKEGLGLHFFYLNVGRPGRPWVTRVEVPAWVAENPDLLNNLHASLVNQCQMLGARPYPYALHRAHEIALVSRVEKDELDLMVQAELARRGVPLGEKSYKQSHKDLSGRTRHSS